SERDIRPTGRDSAGVYGIDLSGDDYVIGAVVAEEGKSLLSVTESGFGKRTDVLEYRLQSRYGKGILNYNVTDKTGKVAGIQIVDDNVDVMIISDDGTIIRMGAEGISLYRRVTQGVILMRLDESIHVIAIACTEKEEDEEIEIADTEVVMEENTEE
ncbi:MAG: DNA gyrase C-terminal beta-propeller domain-containing protein, partial [Christensenella sp.]